MKRTERALVDALASCQGYSSKANEQLGQLLRDVPRISRPAIMLRLRAVIDEVRAVHREAAGAIQAIPLMEVSNDATEQR